MTTNNLSVVTQIPLDQALNKTIFTDLNSAKQYLDHLKGTGLQWDHVGFLSDASYYNLMTLLFNDDELIDVFRFSFLDEENHIFIQNLSQNFQLKIEYRLSEVEAFEAKNLNDKAEVMSLWSNCLQSSYPVTSESLKDFVSDLILKTNDGGRGKDFTVNTIRKVMDDSHGRCMFRGCGQRLDVDDLTGYEGNYGYLAHITASSTKGPRGTLYLSPLLSNEPSNVLLLCDVHHRLVDRIASSYYPTPVLTKMREEHIYLSNKLLDALNYTPVDIFFIPWGVNSQHVEKPNSVAISKSLSVFEHRASDNIINVNSGASESMDTDNSFEENASRYIEKCVNKIHDRTEGSGAAVFVLGPTFALIGFGAKFGNKSKLMPMLRYRDASSWMWPGVQPREDAFIIEEPKIDSDQSEVIVSVKLTALAPKIDKTIEYLNQTAKTEIPVIYIHPPESYGYGNGAIAHPIEGERLANELKKIFTNLKEIHGIEKVHLLVCASNAACVYIGQAVDRFQPEFIVYDYGTKMMEPKLKIYNDGNTVTIEYIIMDNS
ncbi:SAVED domain-containing protein [Psychrobacter sp. K31L]|uniref:SAVED domain-containing protein n=1 Tax=Psychrobacter sp. K31L TaxID=2820758 RepID=UPI001B33B46D|nr:SAVED domain-containing protein [Psychrobacter sp. K31L]MBP3945229.1 SAVED domain-containing protein [Psychrobacter sp. K31L]